MPRAGLPRRKATPNCADSHREASVFSLRGGLAEARARKPRTALASENRCAPEAFACMALRTAMAALRPCGLVAQWLEPTAHNGLVGGSSPSRPTTNSQRTGHYMQA